MYLNAYDFLAYTAKLSRCVIGMEASGGSNYWALKLTELGFDVKLMSPRKVKGFTIPGRGGALFWDMPWLTVKKYAIANTAQTG